MCSKNGSLLLQNSWNQIWYSFFRLLFPLQFKFNSIQFNPTKIQILIRLQSELFPINRESRMNEYRTRPKLYYDWMISHLSLCCVTFSLIRSSRMFCHCVCLCHHFLPTNFWWKWNEWKPIIFKSLTSTCEFM